MQKIKKKPFLKLPGRLERKIGTSGLSLLEEPYFVRNPKGSGYKIGIRTESAEYKLTMIEEEK
ncbi:MAG: hypothetical protein IIZ39_13445 [Blautia sp.]|nr:hypothetical protein [Blautia sp.]